MKSIVITGKDITVNNIIRENRMRVFRKEINISESDTKFNYNIPDEETPKAKTPKAKNSRKQNNQE